MTAFVALDIHLCRGCHDRFPSSPERVEVYCPSCRLETHVEVTSTAAARRARRACLVGWLLRCRDARRTIDV